MDLAVSLLRKSDAPITNIALEVSYNNYLQAVFDSPESLWPVRRTI